MKKRIWIILLVMLQVIGVLFSGCGETAPEEQTQLPQIQTEAPTEPAVENELEILTETPDSGAGTESAEFPVGVLGRQQYAAPQISYAGSVNAYDSNTGRYLRSRGKVGDLSLLSGNEFYSFTMLLTYNGPGVFSWQEACVQVDDCEPWYWSAGQISGGQSARFYVAKHNMQRVCNRGIHTCVWYFDGKPVYSDLFTITKAMDWSAVFEMPTQEQIDAYTNPSACRSPFVNTYIDIPKDTRYTEFVVDFKADYLPNGTYCSLGNWNMDDTYLRKQYSEVYHEMDVGAYAGFSFWAPAKRLRSCPSGILTARMPGGMRQ